MPQDMEKKPQERGERRERGPRRDRRPESEFQEKMVAINRVTKVVKVYSLTPARCRKVKRRCH